MFNLLKFLGLKQSVHKVTIKHSHLVRPKDTRSKNHMFIECMCVFCAYMYIICGLWIQYPIKSNIVCHRSYVVYSDCVSIDMQIILSQWISIFLIITYSNLCFKIALLIQQFDLNLWTKHLISSRAFQN